jgi:hypothetical protein
LAGLKTKNENKALVVVVVIWHIFSVGFHWFGKPGVP